MGFKFTGAGTKFDVTRPALCAPGFTGTNGFIKCQASGSWSAPSGSCKTDSVRAVIFAPAKIGAEDTIELNADASISGSGTTLTFKWSCTRADSSQDSATLVSSLNTYLGTERKSSVSVPASELGDGTAFVFSVQATNNFNMQDTTAVTVNRELTSIPTASLASPSIEHFVSNDLSIQASSVAPACANKCTWKVSYSWTQHSGPSLSFSFKVAASPVSA